MIRAVGTRDLPSGTVTFLFTDVEGSTKLLHALGAEAYADALATHRRTLREAFARHGGVEVDTQGDAFFVAFPTAPGAIAAAEEAIEALSGGPISVRIGLHTGTPLMGEEGYIGEDVHKGARIAAAGHGGQILVSAATAALLDGAELRDLGLHRLKDLSAPERIYQLGGLEHPPLKTLHQTNLPVPATPFLGREAEVAEIAKLLAADEVRLLTLTGPGGTGKTRLALQAAAEVADCFPAGVWWVPLAPLRDPDLVVESAAKALGATGDLAEHIGDKRLLLLLDNFEHLTRAAANLVPLLERCAKLTLLVTSREPLHITAEREYSVDPLAPHEAVELFLTRAMAARRDFTANGEVTRICERLDYLPLAIELAAARVRLLSPKALLARLEERLPLLAGGARDLPERQRTLRATIEWSHELLTSEEQRLFARLAVFRGGWNLEAAEAVVEADLDTLGSLVAKSLVRARPDSGRFGMLETIREFALERLEGSGEADALRRRHAEFFLERAEEAQAEFGTDPRDALTRFEADHDNFRAAFDRLMSVREYESATRLAAAQWRFWHMRGHEPEGKRRLMAAVDADQRPSKARAFALIGLSGMAAGQGDLATARRHAEESLAIYRRLDDAWGIAYALETLGYIASYDDPTAARTLLEESVERFRQVGDVHFELVAARNLAWVHTELGEADRGAAIHEDILRKARETINPRMEAASLQSLAYHAMDRGELGHATTMLRAAFDIDRGVGDVPAIALDLLTLARLLLFSSQPAAAAMVLGRMRGIAAETGAPVEEAYATEYEAKARAELGEPAYADAARRGRSLSTEAAIAIGFETVAE